MTWVEIKVHAYFFKIAKEAAISRVRALTFWEKANSKSVMWLVYPFPIH